MADEHDDTQDFSFEEENEGVNNLAKDPRIEKIKEQLTTCQAERQEYLDGWQRMRADVVNMRKEHEASLSWATQAGKMALAEDIIGALDSFDAAFTGEAWQNVDANWRAGVEYIHAQLLRALEQHGITAFGTVGDTIDVFLHDIAEERPAENGQQPGTVIAVVRKGYRSGDKVIRPARVIAAQ